MENRVNIRCVYIEEDGFPLLKTSFVNGVVLHNRRFRVIEYENRFTCQIKHKNRWKFFILSIKMSDGNVRTFREIYLTLTRKQSVDILVTVLLKAHLGIFHSIKAVPHSSLLSQPWKKK